MAAITVERLGNQPYWPNQSCWRYVGRWKANFIPAIAAITLKSYLQPSTIASGAGAA